MAQGPRIYYGWINVLIAAAAMSATLPGRTYGLGLIKEPLRADLGISDLDFNILNFWAIVIGAAVVLPTGWLIDRFGARLSLGIITTCLGASVLWMSQVTDERSLAAALTLVRGFGQGALSIVAIALVGKWFRRRAGIAMGVFTVLLSIGFVVPLGIVGAIVEHSGWRAGWSAIAIGLLAGLLPIGLMFARSSPETMGVTPDEPAPEQGPAVSMTVGQTLRTPAFWVYTSAAACFNLVFSALTLDNQLLMEEHGLDGGKVNQTILGVLMVSGLPANLIAGFLARKRPLGLLLGVGLAVLLASLLLFPSVNSTGLAAVYAALLGIAGGIITVIYFSVYGHAYGRTHLGGIQAVVQALSVLASAVGPVLLSLIRERNHGNTSPFFYLFAGIVFVLAAAAFMVRPPKIVRAV